VIDGMKAAALIWLLVLGCAAMFILCDSLSAHWGKTDQKYSFVAFVLLAPTSYGLFGLINKRVDLAVAGALVNTIIVVGTSLVGVLVFKEQLTAVQYVGIGLAVAAVTLLNVS
jgi:multidrug transporter EmrE-like cation transporter